MSGRKNTLTKYQNITAGNMASATVSSSVTNIEYMDNVGIQLNFSGSPVGTFAVQVSADYAQDQNGNVLNAGNWVPLVLPYLSSGSIVTATSIPTSVGSPIYMDLNQLSAPWIQVVYTKVSGTGTLNGFITAKMI